MIYEFTVVTDPEVPTRCPSRVDMAIDPKPEGGGEIHWRARERVWTDDRCKFAGEYFEGEVTVEETCCEKVFDIRFPVNKRTFRVALRSDWQSMLAAGTSVISLNRSEEQPFSDAHAALLTRLDAAFAAGAPAPSALPRFRVSARLLPMQLPRRLNEEPGPVGL